MGRLLKSFGGWQFPDHEEHLIAWMRQTNDVADGHQRYQGKKQDAALKWCKSMRVAVDCGAHVGLWAFYLAKHFNRLECFEPVAAHRECFAVNVPGAHVNLHACALGEKDGSVSIHTSPGSSGDSYIDGAGDIPLRRLDDFNLEFVDLWKLDCEGGELPALRGGEETLKRCRPCVIVEQKPGRAQKFGLPETGAVAYLRSLGAVLRAELSGDFILSFE